MTAVAFPLIGSLSTHTHKHTHTPGDSYGTIGSREQAQAIDTQPV